MKKAESMRFRHLIPLCMLLQTMVNSYSTRSRLVSRVCSPKVRSVNWLRRPGIEGEDVSCLKDNGSAASWIRRTFVLSTIFSVVGSQVSNVGAYSTIPEGFKRIPTQFIAALGDPMASEGSNANDWGIWRVDPGPRGVRLQQYSSVLEKNKGVAPAGWKFNPNEWWLEEHGLIMEPPTFPLNPGRYLVTGGRAATAVLSVSEPTNNNSKLQSWSLEGNVKLYDVTHLPCRSAKYTPISSVNSGSPLNARTVDFPVSPGAPMPSVEGTKKQDYAVLFVVGVEEKLKEL